MSSYICSKKHYASIASNLKTVVKKSQFYFEYDLRKKFPMLEVKASQDKIIDKFINTIERLNVETFMRQYYSDSENIENEIKEQLELLKENVKPIFLTELGLYNALKCSNYQIEIEHIKYVRKLTQDEIDAMFFLTEIISNLAKYICNNLPEDPTNTWSID